MSRLQISLLPRFFDCRLASALLGGLDVLLMKKSHSHDLSMWSPCVNACRAYRLRARMKKSLPAITTASITTRTFSGCPVLAVLGRGNIIHPLF
jgi:hypothetical protein